jgi:predicted RNA-binding Zn-ribbon protein involved in translation (DUF1610 family)
VKFIFVVLIALTVTSTAEAGEQFFCKWCGSSNFASLRQMLASSCTRSPTHKHEVYAGAPRKFYVCQYCGFESTSFEQLVKSPCSKSPRKYHDAYEGAEKTSYTCKNCGFESRSFKQLVLSPCRKSPRGYHEAL